MELNGHPINFLIEILERYGDDLTVSFSKYHYRPASLIDERVTMEVLGRDVSWDWLRSILSELSDGWELALNSRVRDRRNRILHIGMIDFAEGTNIDSIRDRCILVFGSNVWSSMCLFDSGRSFHGYVGVLLRPKNWIEFLGKCLLMNEGGKSQVVDSRWVGHRLLGGYCALRWSANSSYHGAMPVRTLYNPVRRTMLDNYGEPR